MQDIACRWKVGNWSLTCTLEVTNAMTTFITAHVDFRSFCRSRGTRGADIDLRCSVWWQGGVVFWPHSLYLNSGQNRNTITCSNMQYKTLPLGWRHTSNTAKLTHRENAPV